MSKNKVCASFSPSFRYRVQNVWLYFALQGPSAYAIWKKQREPQLAAEIFPSLGGRRPSAQQIGPMLFAEWEAMPDEQKRLYETESEAQSIQDFPAQAAFYAFKRDILAKYSYMRDEMEGEGLDANTANRLVSLAWDKMPAVEKQSWAEKARRSERVSITNGPSRIKNDRLPEQVDVSRPVFNSCVFDHALVKIMMYVSLQVLINVKRASSGRLRAPGPLS